MNRKKKKISKAEIEATLAFFDVGDKRDKNNNRVLTNNNRDNEKI